MSSQPAKRAPGAVEALAAAALRSPGAIAAAAAALQPVPCAACGKLKGRSLRFCALCARGYCWPCEYNYFMEHPRFYQYTCFACQRAGARPDGYEADIYWGSLRYR